MFDEFTWQERTKTPKEWRCREWRVGVSFSETGIPSQVVHCFPSTDMTPFHVTNFPNQKSTKVAIALARALNDLEQFRWSVYGAQISG